MQDCRSLSEKRFLRARSCYVGRVRLRANIITSTLGVGEYNKKVKQKIRKVPAQVRVTSHLKVAVKALGTAGVLLNPLFAAVMNSDSNPGVVHGRSDMVKSKGKPTGVMLCTLQSLAQFTISAWLMQIRRSIGMFFLQLMLLAKS